MGGSRKVLLSGPDFIFMILCFFFFKQKKTAVVKNDKILYDLQTGNLHFFKLIFNSAKN